MSNKIQWTKLFNKITFNLYSKVLPTKGNLVYEYNPFRNYRLNENMYEYKGDIYSLYELSSKFDIIPDIGIIKDDNGYKKNSITENGETKHDYTHNKELIKEAFIKGNEGLRKKLETFLHTNKVKGWKNVPDIEQDPILREKGELIDFVTDEFKFSINNPVNILPQPSYDGSVNLILNDGLNEPKMINSRFSPTGKNTYQIIDRKGNNDTNIYDRGEQFDIDTSLYKKVINIPKLKFKGLSAGGNMKIGNYHFYFKLSDADGNETDFVSESGLVSVFIGFDNHSSITTGQRDENSFKQVNFQLNNIDASYDYVTVYYSRETAENMMNGITQYCKIEKKYLVNNSHNCNIQITGFEEVTNISAEEINLHYNLVNSAQTHAICQNMLFLANVNKPEIPYEELQKLSLYFLPHLKEESYDVDINHNYEINSFNKGYIDPQFIYNKTGYWGNEIYRFGVVYIMKNGELSPVFNIRGKKDISNNTSYEGIVLEENGTIPNISYNEETFILNNHETENVKGVVSFKPSKDTDTIYSLNIKVDQRIINELKKYVKGFFIVRQARIPTILAQGITLGLDKESRTPTIPTAEGFLFDYSNNLEKTHVTTNDILGINYISEGFLSRYSFDLVKDKGSVWGKIGKIVGIVAATVALAAATIVTLGAAGIIAGGVAGAIVTVAGASTITGITTAGTSALIAVGSIAGAAAATAAVGAVAGAIQEISLINNRKKKKLEGRKTEVPKGMKVKENEESRLLTHNFYDRFIPKDINSNINAVILCPDYELNQPHFNQIFTGNDHVIETTVSQCINHLNNYGANYFTNEGRHFYVPSYVDKDYTQNYNFKIIPVSDNTKYASVDGVGFRGRAGEAEEAFRYESISEDFKSQNSLETGELDDKTSNNIKINSDIVRGSFGSYLGINNKDNKLGSCETVNIYIPGYSKTNIDDYFYMRMVDNSTFYAVTDRFDINEFQSNTLLNDTSTNNIYDISVYRGDCYICQFTHRVNRNFNDPSAPYNSEIIDKKCWKENYDPDNSENFEKINLGDVNAVELGMWVTFKVRSSNNLNIRTLDGSIVDETSMTGHQRGYYPYYPMSTEPSFKHPESQLFNRGFSKQLGKRWNFEMPDVPFFKNCFNTRVMYSTIHVNDAFKNGFRTFKGNAYRDYTTVYGSIIKLVEYNENLLCVFEHGIALISVNERALAAQGSNGNVYINTSNVLPENPMIISDTFGSQWSESIIKTDRGVYGVDTIAKKIWMFNGKLQCISDFSIQEFLNNNITLTERELTPTIGIRNVKTHYNKYKNDVMFTFYDNLYDFEEKSWNLCWNELLQKWITFYSWLPSYSENIYNQYFSFDRTTSKWISKLGSSNANSSFADGVVLDNNIFEDYCQQIKDPDEGDKAYYNTLIGTLSLANRELPKGDNIECKIEYELIPDNYGNHKLFHIEGDKLYLKSSKLSVDSINHDPVMDYLAELFVTVDKNGNEYTDEKDKSHWYDSLLRNDLKVKKDDKGKRIPLSKPFGKIVYLLNIKANIKVSYLDADYTPTLEEQHYKESFNNNLEVDAGYYKSVVAVAPKYNVSLLTTDFWKHGKSGIIDISDKTYPSYWYGKQHPFEFEFVVTDPHGFHKIFDNLEIISNNAEPDSFHFEIEGDCYEFSKYKKNMYIRQEATKHLYNLNGSDIVYDKNYSNLDEIPRDYDGCIHDKSTIFPLYYVRQDTINEIEDSYHQMQNTSTKDYSSLSGAEIKYYNTLDEYRIVNHVKAVDINKHGRLRGNMQYNEGKWYIQINPLNIVQKNEEDYDNNKIPIEIGVCPIPNEVYENYNGDIKKPDDRNIIEWNWEESDLKEVKVKDKWVKIRVRYKGDKLAIISAIKTLYSISYA